MTLVNPDTGEQFQTEGEHHTAKCLVCRSRINIPLDPYCCTVCMNSHSGARKRAMERVHNNRLLMMQMERQVKKKNKVRRKKIA